MDILLLKLNSRTLKLNIIIKPRSTTCSKLDNLRIVS